MFNHMNIFVMFNHMNMLQIQPDIVAMDWKMI